MGTLERSEKNLERLKRMLVSTFSAPLPLSPLGKLAGSQSQKSLQRPWW
jgi:hypothetical protein